MPEVTELTDAERQQLVTTKVTCPFLGSAVATGLLPVRNHVENPLANIEDVRELGNRGGGDLGTVLALFAKGNHARMRGTNDLLSEDVPEGAFSLELPGSQGSHPGHSGILQKDPKMLASGRFNQEAFDRLVSHSKAVAGFITRSEVAEFIAENVHADPQSRVGVASGLETIGQVFTELFGGDSSGFVQELTKLGGGNNLIGSCGEFGLLFAFFANDPDAKLVNGEPALSIDNLRLVFKEKRLPNHWDTWPKEQSDWEKNATQLTVSAKKAFRKLHSQPASVSPSFP